MKNIRLTRWIRIKVLFFRDDTTDDGLVNRPGKGSESTVLGAGSNRIRSLWPLGLEVRKKVSTAVDDGGGLGWYFTGLWRDAVSEHAAFIASVSERFACRHPCFAHSAHPDRPRVSWPLFFLLFRFFYGRSWKTLVTRRYRVTRSPVTIITQYARARIETPALLW